MRKLRLGKSLLFTASLICALANASSAKDADTRAACGPDKGAMPPWMDYVNAKTDFEFKLISKVPIDKGMTLYQINMTSQIWHGATWKHTIVVVVPAKPVAPDLALVLLGGLPGTAGANSLAIYAQMAEDSGVPCVVLNPMVDCFGQHGRFELTNYATAQFLKTKDPTWIIGAPCARAAARGMDAVEAVLSKDGLPVKRFILTGHSRDGMVSWFGAIADPRVQGIIPVGADGLNLTAPSQHQTMAFIQSVAGNLQSEVGKAFIASFDPYSFRDRLTVPKLIVSGTNDHIYDPNSVNEYWDGLPGAKWHLYLEGADHAHESGNPKTHRAIAVFARLLAEHKEPPKLEWKFANSAGKITLTGTTSNAAKSARLWVGLGGNLSQLQFTERPAKLGLASPNETAFTADIAMSPTGYTAVFAEIEYEHEGKPYSLTTGIFIAKPE